jgi:hypothetical protein
VTLELPKLSKTTAICVSNESIFVPQKMHSSQIQKNSNQHHKRTISNISLSSLSDDVSSTDDSNSVVDIQNLKDLDMIHLERILRDLRKTSFVQKRKEIITHVKQYKLFVFLRLID